MTVETLLNILQGCPKNAQVIKRYWNDHGKQEVNIDTVEVVHTEKDKTVILS